MHMDFIFICCQGLSQKSDDYMGVDDAICLLGFSAETKGKESSRKRRIYMRIVS